MKVELPYGSRAYAIDLTGRAASVLDVPALPEPPPVESLLEVALSYPTGTPLRVRPGDQVTLVISDPTREEPRAAFLDALRPRLDGAQLTIAIATGTHGPCQIERLGLPASTWRGVRVVNHDGNQAPDAPGAPFVELGTTSRGTPVRVHRCLVEADLVIATGCIRPHYFAGFGAGVKALFPGLGESTAIRINHGRKTEPGARAGIVDGNPIRDDLDEAARLITTPTFLVNGVVGPDERVHAVVAGDIHAAFRAGVTLARPWFTVRARPAPVVIASDALPVAASLYQAAKIAAAAAPLVAEDGTLVVVAQCSEGIGPLEVVNEAILRIGVFPRLARGVRVFLVSDLGEAETKRTLLAYAPSVAAILDRTPGDVLVLPRASHLLVEATS